jgi:hypothetical protein
MSPGRSVRVCRDFQFIHVRHLVLLARACLLPGFPRLVVIWTRSLCTSIMCRVNGPLDVDPIAPICNQTFECNGRKRRDGMTNATLLDLMPDPELWETCLISGRLELAVLVHRYCSEPPQTWTSLLGSPTRPS